MIRVARRPGPVANTRYASVALKLFDQISKEGFVVVSEVREQPRREHRRTPVRALVVTDDRFAEKALSPPDEDADRSANDEHRADN